MVGRLVQNQEINILIHQNAKLQAAQFAAGENGHTLEHVLPPKMEGRQTVAGRLRRTIRLINHGVHQIAFTVGEGDDLRKVRRLDGRAGLDTSAQRLFLSQKKLQKGRFTRTRLSGQKHGLAGILYETQSILELFVVGIYCLGQNFKY